MSSKFIFDWTNLGEMYVGKQLSAPQIASAMGCSDQAVLDSLKRQGIPRRNAIEQHRLFRDLMGAKMCGSLNPSWNGGKWRDKNGYIHLRLLPDDFFLPMSDGSNAIYEHRLIMANHLGRCLLPWEIVHHKNGIRDDNRLENLELLPGRKYHLIDQLTKAHMKRQERQIRLLKIKLDESRMENRKLKELLKGTTQSAKVV